MADLTDDFIRFLREYGVIGLAIAVVIGTATKDLVSALVADIIMPIVAVFLPDGGWREATTTVAGVEFATGHFIAALLDFAIIALIIYLFVRYALKKEQVEKV